MVRTGRPKQYLGSGFYHVVKVEYPDGSPPDYYIALSIEGSDIVNYLDADHPYQHASNAYRRCRQLNKQILERRAGGSSREHPRRDRASVGE